ncbi:MAG: NAD/NADP octopine/nopaline dehydrogenase family protein [Anaerolineales bacterium]|nr:NAD/NADP octopine/nopaline dehydrogenase family protein [Anaerolineales bacterium]
MTVSNDLSIAVLGAGHGGRAMAADLAARGFRIRLYNRTPEHIEAIQARGGIELQIDDDQTVFGSLELAGHDMGEVIQDCQLLMVVVPASGHADIARAAAPHLADGQIVVLHPGRTGGALEFRHVLKECGCSADVIVAEAGTLLFASRATGPAEARIFRRKNTVPLAALPATRTEEVLEILQELYPQFVAAPNVLHTSLNNMGAVFHPVITLLNAGWIERTKGEFQFYVDGVTESTAHMLEVIDRERVTIAACLGVRAQTALEWLATAYSATGENLYEAMHDNPGYAGIMAPRSLRHRYIFEDVPYSLVPLAELGRRFGVNVWAIDSMIRLSCVLHRTDYRYRGRTLERMGLVGLQISEINALVNTGTRLDAPMDRHVSERDAA